jgi:hypothetical protein
MSHILNTSPPPEHESTSEIIAVFRLSTLPGWIYVAMAEYEQSDWYDDIDALLAECKVVAREDTTMIRWDENGVVLSMGTGDPIFYEVVGEEFQQTFLSLSHSATFYDSPESFSKGEWVCIGRPGTYWGDVGFVQSLSDDEDEDRITILLVPRITDEANQAIYNTTFVRPALRTDLCPHTSDGPPLSKEDEAQIWFLGRDRMTKEGLLLRSFAPWELRKSMVDGADLYLLPLQDAHFRRLLPPEDWLHMPPVRNHCAHFMRGERVQVAGHKCIVAGLESSFRSRENALEINGGAKLWYAEMQRIYSETAKGHVLCHSSFIVRQHKEGDTAFSFALKENVVVLACDYLKHEVTIQLRATTARKYRKETLVSQFTLVRLSIDLLAGKSRAPELFTIPALAPYSGLHERGAGIQADHRAISQPFQMARHAHSVMAEARSVHYWQPKGQGTHNGGQGSLARA